MSWNTSDKYCESSHGKREAVIIWKRLSYKKNYTLHAKFLWDGELYSMKKAVGAILWHCTGYTDSEYRHRYCPRGVASWCKWQADKLKGNNTYKDNITIPEWIHDVIEMKWMLIQRQFTSTRVQ